MRWLVLDEVLSIETGKRAVSKSRIPEREFCAEVLMVEMMAQTGGLLMGAATHFKEDVIFAKVEEAIFYPDYQSGQEILIEASGEGVRPEGAWLQGKVSYKDRCIAKAHFLLMNAGHLVPGTSHSITFHRAFMEHFKIEEQVK